MPKTKVLFAYCAELERSVSIDEARIAFFSQDKDNRKRYTFSCSDRQRCDVSITGVNYHVKAEDGQKYKAAHFRSHVPHRPGCEWLQFTEEEGLKQQAGESDAEFKERKSRQKLTDAISSFDPNIGDVKSQPKGGELLLPVQHRALHQTVLVQIRIIAVGATIPGQTSFSGLLIFGRRLKKSFQMRSFRRSESILLTMVRLASVSISVTLKMAWRTRLAV